MKAEHKDLSPVEKALLTWYKPDNDKYNDPLHPTMKLAGEVGELLDLYAKHLFKPGFNWMDCKWCKKGNDNHHQEVRWCNVNPLDDDIYTPLVLDELGDIWYYLRILAWIYGLKLSDIIPKSTPSDNADLTKTISDMLSYSSELLSDYLEYGEFNGNEDGLLFWTVDSLIGILNSLDCTLEELTELNYLKLNSDNTNHGWANAL